jgi:hypothetical protein
MEAFQFFGFLNILKTSNIVTATLCASNGFLSIKYYPHIPRKGGDFMEKKRSLLHADSFSCVHEKTELCMKFWMECNGGPGRVQRFSGFYIADDGVLAKIPGNDECFPTSGKRLCEFRLRAVLRELHNGFPLCRPMLK